MAFVLSAGSATADDFAALQHDYIAFTHVQDPLRAGARGDRAALARWPDDSAAALAAQDRALESFQARLKALAPVEPLSEEGLDRAVMGRQIDISLQSLALGEARIPFQNAQGFFTLPDTQAQVTTLQSEADAEAWLTRIRAIPAYFAVETANMQQGIDTRFTQPALMVNSAITVLDKAAALPPAQSPLLLPFDTLPASIPAARRDALRAQGLSMVETEVRPAQLRLAAFFRDRYLPAARTGLGASSLPGGAGYYAFAIRRETTTDFTPQQIHALGLSEIARIRAEMETVKAQDGFTGDLKAYAAKLKSDPANYAPTAEVYAEKAGEIAKRIDYLLPRYFGLLPRLTYGVRAKPAAVESTSDGYLPGSPESGQAGAVVYSASAAPHEPLYNLPAWLLHEGVPGHHLQIALAQENTALPEYRRNDDITAYVEGWALYSEGLGEEVGVYRTPAERFGRLSMEMWRACRLVIDTGVHALGWTREQAAACLKDNTAMTDTAIYGEVDRYIGWPAQALGYKIGELQMLAMRRKAEAALGPRFDLRGFHDALLGAGALPMDLLAARMDAWTTAQRSTPQPAR